MSAKKIIKLMRSNNFLIKEKKTSRTLERLYGCTIKNINKQRTRLLLIRYQLPSGTYIKSFTLWTPYNNFVLLTQIYNSSNKFK